jgi:hypothetical protein
MMASQHKSCHHKVIASQVLGHSITAAVKMSSTIIITSHLLITSYKWCGHLILLGPHSLSTGERPFIDIFQDRRYWVIHVITIGTAQIDALHALHHFLSLYLLVLYFCITCSLPWSYSWYHSLLWYHHLLCII